MSCKHWDRLKLAIRSFFDSKSLWLRFLRFLLGVTSGFAALSIVLFVVGKCCPDTYNFLTQWANAPQLSKISKCNVDALVPSTDNVLKYYDISIVVSDPTDSIYDLLFSVNGPGISVYDPKKSMEPTDEDDRNFLVKRFVSSKRARIRKFSFRVSVNHEEQGTLPFQQGEISEEECPLVVNALKRKK